jgi:hypothetical protein
MNQLELLSTFKFEMIKRYPKAPVTNPMNSRHADMWAMYQVAYQLGQSNK